MTYRVLVTASTTWRMRSSIWGELYRLADEHGFEGFTVVHGDAEGGDAIAQDWALRNAHRGVINEPHRAQWRINGWYNPRAGFERNAHMVNLGADKCLALAARCADPRCVAKGLDAHYTHGTTHCAGLAAEAGIPVEWRKTP